MAFSPKELFEFAAAHGIFGLGRGIANGPAHSDREKKRATSSKRGPIDPRRYPLIPFHVAPGNYSVIDGDTISVRDPIQGRVRLRSVSAPEMPTSGARHWEKIIGRPASQSPGDRARAALIEVLGDRALLVTPTGQDVYGRLLGDVHVSGAPGSVYDAKGAGSVEWALLGRGVVQQTEDEALPDAGAFGGSGKTRSAGDRSLSAIAASHSQRSEERSATPGPRSLRDLVERDGRG